jgi:hypothetical protein
VEDRVKRYQTAIALDRLAGVEPPRKRRKKGKKRRALDWMRPEAPPRGRAPADVRPAAVREPTLQPVVAAVRPDPWGPAVRMGRHLRVQAEVGYRAAVIELRPGLFLVAEVPERATRPDFGVVPLLAPLILKAASDALGPRRHDRDDVDEDDEIRCSPPPKALPGPVEPPRATEEPPLLGWADDQLLVDVGCDCARGGRR